MHCLVITIFYCVDHHFYCVDSHFTSFVVIGYGLYTMNFVIPHVQYIGKQLVMYIRLAIDISLFSNIGYRKTEKFDIGTPLSVTK